MTVPEMYAGLKTHFHIPNPQKYLCTTSYIQNRGVLDIFKLDDLLHLKYGQYEDKGLSMKEVIRKEYGETTVKFVENCL